MKLKMRCSLLTVFLFVNLAICFSQRITINGDTTRTTLRWSDFTGAVDNTSSFYAFTYWNINYRYKFTLLNGIVTLKDLTVDLKLDSVKSWTKKEYQNLELLQHEQGHFNFGRLCQLEVLQQLGQLKLEQTSFKETIDSTFKAIFNKYKEMEIRYDDETEHYRNKRKQAEWNALLQEELKNFGEATKNG
jgi:hypothetical protein